MENPLPPMMPFLFHEVVVCVRQNASRSYHLKELCVGYVYRRVLMTMCHAWRCHACVEHACDVNGFFVWPLHVARTRENANAATLGVERFDQIV